MKVHVNCPICYRKIEHMGDTFPFCSYRCQKIDLSNWLGEKYVVPVESHSTEGSIDGEELEAKEEPIQS